MDAEKWLIAPVVAPADTRCRFRVTVPPASLPVLQEVLHVTLFSRHTGAVRQIESLVFDSGAVVFDAVPEGEQEHSVVLAADGGDGNVRQLAELHIYSVEPDLLALRPLKGDFHLHTQHSDGMGTPAYVAARCRQIGMDFAAITDHYRYAPSIEAMQAYADTQADMALYPGEEVHPPGNPVHMVNFGGRFSVNALFADETAFQRAVAGVRERIPRLPEGADPEQYASTVWCLEQVREGGGIGILCHPYWVVSGGRYNMSEPLTEALLTNHPFDALEVIGGYGRHEAESNALQVARYQEERAQGNALPVVGLSDSHGCDNGQLFGWYYTIVFARSVEFEDLADAIRSQRSLAVEHMAGEAPRVHGPFRLTRFAHFLLREYFPAHDALCAQEGLSMLAHAAGDAGGRIGLARMQGQCLRLHRRLYGLIDVGDCD